MKKIPGQYAVVGNPIAQSNADFIYHHFATTLAISFNFRKILAPIDGFQKTIHTFFNTGGKGLNVTIPFKQEAYTLADEVTDAASIAGAANLLTLENGIICADNTDGNAFIADLAQHNVTATAKKILLLGSGGVAKGILAALFLLKNPPYHITIVDLNLNDAEKLKQHVDAYLQQSLSELNVTSKKECLDIVALDYSSFPDKHFDLIINATSASLQDVLPPIPPELKLENTSCYDVVYNKPMTIFNEWALKNGAEIALDGKGMLVETLAKAFKTWLGYSPDVTSAIKKLQEKYSS